MINLFPYKKTRWKYCLIIIGFLILFPFSTYAQKESNIWYFGDYAGLDFNSGEPVALVNSAMYQGEGCASISDSSGNILFYTNGMTVWDKNHAEMPNGFGLLGHVSSSQSAVIVQKPGFNTTYYIFTTDAAHNDLVNGLNYSIIDMSQNGGLGDVISKNNLLHTPVSEKVTAVSHSNQIDVWIITHEWNSNSFRAYLLTNTGLNSIENSIPGYPVISSTGSYHGGSIWGAIGYMKASQNGNKIGLAIHNDKYEIFDFANLTGIVSNPISITSPVSIRQYGVEFSPDESKLYVSKITFPSYIYQYDLNSNKEDLVNKSAYLVAESLDDHDYSALQLGPDGKIYVAINTGLYLSAINNPNEPGELCNYTEDAVFLENRLSYRGLPNIIPEKFTLNFFYNNNCFGDTTFFTISDFTIIDSVFWDFDDPASGSLNYSTEFNPYHVFSEPDTFNVKLISYYSSITDTIIKSIIINPSPTVFLGNDTILCTNESIILDPGSGYSSYLWQDSSLAATFVTDITGLYWVQVSNEFGCLDIDSIFIELFPSPEINLGNDTAVCSGEPVLLDPGFGFISYLWQDGSSNQFFYTNQTGAFWVQVIDSNFCYAYDTISLEFILPNPDIGNDTVICFGDSVTFIAGESFINYLWQDGSVLPFFTADSTGLVWCEVIDTLGCVGLDSVFLNIIFPPLVSLVNDTSFCFGDSLWLNILPYGNNYNLTWQDGSEDSVFLVTQQGNYWVIASNQCGSNADSVFVNVQQLPFVFLGNDTILAMNDYLILDAGSGFENYLWNDGSYYQTLTVNEAGNYWVNVFDGMCYNTDTINIEPVDCEMLVPIVITPNWDGDNDYFFANTSEDIYDFSLIVFSRWGEKIWETENKNDKWDGTKNGKPAADGTYYWITKYKCLGSPQKFIRRGSVTVLR